MIIYKYINKHFEKSFIRINKFFITVLIFLIYKFGGGIRVYIDYKSLNNVIIKNYYSISLIYKTFDVLYYIKIYIKFNIIIMFNRLYIIPGDE